MGSHSPSLELAIADTMGASTSGLGRRPADALPLDLSLPGRSGLDLLPEIRKLQPELKVLVGTMHVDRTLAEAAPGSGATGPAQLSRRRLQVPGFAQRRPRVGRIEPETPSRVLAFSRCPRVVRPQ